MNNETTTKTWKDWVDWWPTYLIIGISLAYMVDKSGVIQAAKDKFSQKA